MTGIISGAIGVLLGISAVYKVYAKIKGILKEVSELLTAIAEAAEDDKFTAEELQGILGAWKDVIDAVKALK